MAELPDLSVFAETLNKKFKGKTLKTLEIKETKKLNTSKSELKKALESQALTQVKRVGKTLQFHFGNNEILGLHLMLRGTLKEIGDDQPLPTHTIIAFHFASGSGFAVTDTLKQATLTLNPPRATVPDALEISEEEFLKLLQKRKKAIKKLLMDQKAIRGIGNSYADEILWKARISPKSTADKIPEEQAKALHSAIGKILKQAIKGIKKANKNELRGELRDFLKIHGAHLKTSPTGKPIKTEKIAGRSTYFTAEQKLYR